MNTLPNPYLGPRAFEVGETLYGRERELRQLKSLLVAERIVLLHSPSGAGKTSLIQAGLLPNLPKTFNVLPVIRLNLEPPLEIVNSKGFNRYTFSMLAALEEGQPAESRLSNAELVALGLDAYIEKRLPPGDMMLIFDQFEEILTTSPADREAKAVFFADLGAALRNPDRWALFAIREDYLGALDPYLRPIPDQMETRFRLDLLGLAAAKQAIQNPARAAGVDFSDEAANKLVDDLREMRVQKPDGTTENLPGPHIEPVQLQVVCYRLWEATPGQARISETDLGAIGKVDDALRAYYDSVQMRVIAQTSVSEADLREWFEYKLLTPEGLRGQVLRGKGASEGLDNNAIALLEDAHLIRAEKRAGATWYELAHDRLVMPVRESNRRWFEQHKHVLQVQAALWTRQERTENLLLRGKDLEKALTLVEERKLSREEQEFLDASRKVAAAARRERMGQAFLWGLTIVSLVVAAVAVYFWWMAKEQTKIAQEQTTIAKSQAKEARLRELIFQASSLPFDTYMLLSEKLFLTEDNIRTRSALLGAVTASPQLLQYLRGHKNWVFSVAFSPNGKILASGSYDNTIILWDTSTNKPLAQLKGHGGAVRSLAFSPDGKILASGSYDNSIILWSTETFQPIAQPLLAHSEAVLTLVFSPDGKLLASGGSDKTIILWDLDTKKPSGETLKGHADQVTSINFSPDGTMLASGSYDKTIILWNMATRQPIGDPLRGHTDRVLSIAFSPNGKILASGSWDYNILLWDVTTQQPIGEPLRGHTGLVYSVAFSPDGSSLASGGSDNIIYLWDVEKRRLVETPFNPLGQAYGGHTGAVRSLAFSPDGETLASGSFDNNNNLILWAVRYRQPITQILEKHIAPVRSVVFSPNGQLLASGGDDDTIIMWDTSSLQPLSTLLSKHTGSVVTLAFSPNGSFLASGSWDESIILWDVIKRQPIGTPLVGNAGAVHSIAFSPDGNMIASGNHNGTVILWDVATHQIIGTPLVGNAGPVHSVAFSPDGKILASGNENGTIILWDTTTQKPLGEPLQGHIGAIYSIAFSLDGKNFASGSGGNYNNLIIWEIEQQQYTPHFLIRHTLPVSSVTFSPDSKFLASGSEDQVISLWDVKTYQPLGLGGHIQPVYSLAFSPDGKKLASGSKDQTVNLWNLDPQSWLEMACARVGRNFTQTEWMQFFPDEKYYPVCSQWPVEVEGTLVP